MCFLQKVFQEQGSEVKQEVREKRWNLSPGLQPRKMVD